MIPDRKGRITPVSWYSPGCVAIGLMVAALSLFPANVYSSWNEIDGILTKAYGTQAARECRDYYSTLNIPDDQVAAVRDVIARLVEAEYPSGCPREYLSLAADLSKAGVDLDDLTNKIREGIAKKVEPQRLNKVIARRGEALQEARVVVLNLEAGGVEFLDRQMTYSVIADYLLRGISRDSIIEKISIGELSNYPALENLVR